MLDWAHWYSLRHPSALRLSCRRWFAEAQPPPVEFEGRTERPDEADVQSSTCVGGWIERQKREEAAAAAGGEQCRAREGVGRKASPRPAQRRCQGRRRQR